MLLETRGAKRRLAKIKSRDHDRGQVSRAPFVSIEELIFLRSMYLRLVILNLAEKPSKGSWDTAFRLSLYYNSQK